MKAWMCVPVIVLALAGCAGKTAYRDSCGSQLDAAWKELDLAKAEGFAGTVSYSKALSLLKSFSEKNDDFQRMIKEVEAEIAAERK